MKNSIYPLFIILLMVSLTACSAGAPPSPEEIGNVERGREIFETGAGLTTLVCTNCHSLDGSILKENNRAPSLQGISTLAAERVSGLSAVEYLEQSILDPSAYVVEGFDVTMDSSYQYLFSEEDINDLVAFMLTQ